MYVHKVELEKRPQGTVIVSSEGEQPFLSGIASGCTVTLRFREVGIQAQVLDLEPDGFFLGQIVAIDGFLGEDGDTLEVGSYLRFREQHIFSALPA